MIHTGKSVYGWIQFVCGLIIMRKRSWEEWKKDYMI